MKFNYHSNYDGLMDKECITICNYLNSLPSVKTSSSCSGHGKKPFLLFFECTNWKALSFLGRCIDSRYFIYGDQVEIKLSNSDVNDSYSVFELKTLFAKGETAYKIVDCLCKNMILHINHENYIKYFMKDLSQFLVTEEIGKIK